MAECFYTACNYFDTPKPQKMKILKNPAGIIYDTKNLEHTYRNPRKNYGYPLPLENMHENTPYTFLRQYFPADHEIFENFSNSYYYKLSPAT